MTASTFIEKNVNGEESRIKIYIPTGYRYCRSSMSLKSIVPLKGARGSLFSGRATEAFFIMDTWTPVLPAFQGRSWVEGAVDIVLVKSSYADEAYGRGYCVRADDRLIFWCRGSGCRGGALDRGQSLDASSPPGADSRVGGSASIP